MADDAHDFYASMTISSDFGEAMKPLNYRPLPEDWFVGFCDVVGSTQAVAQGRYKTINMVGAGAIAAVANALKLRPFPFVFGGDGASLAVSASDAPIAGEALAAMAAFARSEFELELRVAMIPVRDIRAAGRDVRIARFGASPHCAYAMFAGGGLSWAETEAKRGKYALRPAPPDARPDLANLSCRWSVAQAKHGVVLSVIVSPRGDDPRFVALIDEIVKMAAGAADGGRPVAVDNLSLRTPATSINLEAAAGRRGDVSRTQSFWAATKRYLVAFLFHSLMLRTKHFDMAAYVSDVAANADFRKFDDGLRMTLDCSEEFADALEARLAAAGDFAEYGTFRQRGAQVTCFVPSYSDRGHVHFVDGAGGGYTMAATAMKGRRVKV